MFTNAVIFLGDADRVAAKIKGKLPGDSPNAEKEFKKYGEEAGAKLDKAVRSLTHKKKFKSTQFEQIS